MAALKPVVILGGHGSAQIVASVIEDINRLEPTWDLQGYLNDFEEPGTKIGAYPVVGRTDEAAAFAERGVSLHYAMRNAKFAKQRIARFEAMGIPTEAFATFIHPTAHTSGNAGIGHGSLLCALTNLSFGARVCNHNHLYGSSFIGHDSTVEDYAWIANNAAIGARCTIGRGSHVGTNSCLREDVNMGAFSILGLGGVLLKSIEDGAIAVGNPAKVIGNVSRYEDDPSSPAETA